MKKHFLLFASIIAFAGIFVSCNNEPDGPEPPKEATPQNTADYLLRFVPYEIGQSLVFANESLGREWTIKPYEYKNSYYDPNEVPVFPKVNIIEERGGDYKGQWIVDIQADLLEEGVSRVADKMSSTSVSLNGDNNTDTIAITWMLAIRLSATEFYDGGLQRYYCTRKDFFTFIGDTVHLTLNRMREGQIMVEAPSGCYINMVKDKGITDFCVDGKTIWKRKK